jgi:uncharacterized Zn-finger protein
VWVKHLNRLLANQNKSKSQTYFCERCLYGFTRQDLLERHIPECRGINERAIRIEMPTKDNKIIKFKNYQNQLKVPWVIYADFEANITKIEGPANKPETSYTQRTQLHEACGYALRAVRSDGRQ